MKRITVLSILFASLLALLLNPPNLRGRIDSPGGGAPTDATYITQTPNASLSAEQALNSLTANRLLRNTAGGVLADSLLSDDGTNVTLTSGRIIISNSSTVPVLTTAADNTTGWGMNAARPVIIISGVIAYDTPGGDSFDILNAGGRLRLGSPVDVIIRREAAAILQQGEDSATPIAQTYKSPDGSGTDIAGGKMTLAAGRGTGTGAGGLLALATAPAGTTGSSQNALVDRITITGAGDIGFYGVAAVARPAAYTQTFATAARTHANSTFAAVSETGATQTTPFGYTTAAQADSIPVELNDLADDMANLKQLVNSVIDDLQANGLLQ